MTQDILGTEKIYKLFLKYCIPAVLTMVIVGSQTIIDGIFLGNYVGSSALASVNIVLPFMQIVFAFSMIISIGSLSFMGRSLGEKKLAHAQDIFKTALILITSTAFIVAIIGKLFSVKIAVLLGANDILTEGVSLYINTISNFIPFMAFMFIFGFTDRLLGKPELFLKGMILSVIVNVSLDFLFIKQLGFGIQGAAYATGIAYFASLIFVAGPLLSKKSQLNIYKGKFNKAVILPMIYNGSSEGVSSIATAISVYLFNTTFMKIGGVNGVAAFTAISYLAQFGTMLMFGITDGVTPILSYNYGSNQHHRLDDVIKLSRKINLIIGVLVFTMLFGFGNQLVSIFVSDNRELFDFAVQGSKIYAFAFLLNGFSIVQSGYYTAIGNAKLSIIIAASRGLVFIVIGINILPMIFGTQGVWMTVPFTEFMTFLISVYLVSNQKKLYAQTT